MKYLSLVLVTILFQNCALLIPPKKINYKGETDSLLNENKFDEAQVYINQNKPKIDSYTFQRLQEQIDAHKKCSPYYNECTEKLTQATDLMGIRQCKKTVDKYCTARDIAPAVKSLASKLRNKLHDKTNLSKASADLFSSCDSGMRWGYNRFKRDGVVLFEDKHKVFGAFETQTDCEGKRAAETKWQTKSCIQYYAGKNTTVDLYVVKAISIKAYRPAQTITLQFLNKVDCESAAANGFNYIELDGLQHKLSSVSSQDESRIVGACEKKITDVCVKFEDVRLSSEIL